jgi:uncharacterized protein
MKSITIGAACLAVLLTSAPSLKAQTPPSQTSADVPSARRLELARELVALSGMDSTMVGALRNMAEQMKASAGAGLSPERQARLKIYSDAQSDALEKMVPKIEQIVTTGYAQTYSEQELSDLLAFYKTPSGRSMVAKQPQFMQGVTMQIVGLVPQMRRDIGTAVCAKMTCTDAQKTAFFGAQPAAVH